MNTAKLIAEYLKNAGYDARVNGNRIAVGQSNTTTTRLEVWRAAKGEFDYDCAHQVGSIVVIDLSKAEPPSAQAISRDRARITEAEAMKAKLESAGLWVCVLRDNTFNLLLQVGAFDRDLAKKEVSRIIAPAMPKLAGSYVGQYDQVTISL